MVSLDDDERREELWYAESRTPKEEMELQRLLLEYRGQLRRLRKLTEKQADDLAWIFSNPPEERMEELRVKADWERALLLGGALRRSASGTVGPGPYHHLREDYEANRQDILDKRLRILASTGRVVPPIVEEGVPCQVRGPKLEERMDRRRT